MLGGIASALAGAHFAKRAEIARAQEAAIRVEMADHAALNALQSEYHNWAKMPPFVKRGGQWFAVVEYPPTVPRVSRKSRDGSL